MLVLGAQKYVDWRFYKPENIDEAIIRIKEVNGVVGIAHPFSIGNPVCTGCRWEFNIENWDNVDYIEVWSGNWPLIQLENDYAFRLWTDLLNKGHRLSATSGHDWHRLDDKPKHYGVTYLGIEDHEFNQASAIKAIKSGRTYRTNTSAVLSVQNERAFASYFSDYGDEIIVDKINKYIHTSMQTCTRICP